MIGSRLTLAARQMMVSQRRNCVHFPEGYRGAVSVLQLLICILNVCNKTITHNQ